ncbi:MAG: MotA/TolQ/ExbB proton channel family protein [Gammaproteobacteria bacterium]|nr:MotA/TolQ/ExbB proton channel family protein [Gammaproteobacteria bacterium]MCB1926054.1 MotA/TolQ/ExbB proton channel family protein [Gammaproteobacteria bacterium]
MRDVIGDMQRFLDAGGPVLWLIAATALVIGTLVIERYWFLYLDAPARIDADVRAWQQRGDRHTWAALQVREALIAGLRARLQGSLPVIRVLVTLCPLFGLLGTVTGMMSVFDVIALLGTGNVRAMASGISQATMPTMAGMVVALPGLYLRAGLQREVRRRVDAFADRLTIA